MTEGSTTIAALNDAFRATAQAGCVFVTSGIRALGEGTIRAVLDKVRSYKAFNASNDPHQDHDFGSFEHGGQSFFWKIHYFDAEMRYGSDDPSNSATTTRVLTVMLGSEY